MHRIARRRLALPWQSATPLLLCESCLFCSFACFTVMNRYVTGVREKGRHEGDFLMGLEVQSKENVGIGNSFTGRPADAVEAGTASAIVQLSGAVGMLSTTDGRSGAAASGTDEAYNDNTQLLVLAVLLDAPTNRPNPDIEGPRGLTPLQVRLLRVV